MKNFFETMESKTLNSELTKDVSKGVLATMLEEEKDERKRNGIKYMVKTAWSFNELWPETSFYYHTSRHNQYLDAVVQNLIDNFQGIMKVKNLETEIIQYVKLEGKTLTFVSGYGLK